MGKVYNNSTITLSAAGTAAVHDGFIRLTPKDIVTYLEPYSLINRPTEVQMSFVGRKLPGQMTFLPETKDPLDTRGWTLQESLLSARILRFNEHGVSWRCSSYATELPSSSFALDLSDDMPAQLFTGAPRIVFSDEEQLVLWRKIVRDYTERSFTVASDRTLAIGGIASELADFFNDVFVAGMWKRTLIRDLHWFLGFSSAHDRGLRKTDHDTGILPFRATALEGPSWSWMSCTGAVNFVGVSQQNEVYAKLVDCHVELAAAENQYGAANSGIALIDTSALKENCPRKWDSMTDEGPISMRFIRATSGFDSHACLAKDETRCSQQVMVLLTIDLLDWGDNVRDLDGLLLETLDGGETHRRWGTWSLRLKGDAQLGDVLGERQNFSII